MAGLLAWVLLTPSAKRPNIHHFICDRALVFCYSSIDG
jgi:hypothetical protein